MRTSEATTGTRLRVGLFTLLALALIGAATVYVNDKPFWWRDCNLQYVSIDDATGLKTKSPIRSLGLQIGYLKKVELFEEHVRLGICITAPVEVLSTTKAYVRGEGFLGDKFVELKPVKYVGSRAPDEPATIPSSTPPPQSGFIGPERGWKFAFINEANAAETKDIPVGGAPDAGSADGSVNGGSPDPTPTPVAGPATVGPKKARGREIPVGKEGQDVGQLVGRVDSLVNEMTSLTNNLKSAINPQELRQTMNQLNRTLENASRTLSPEGGLNTTAQRTLAKLEDAIENLRDMMARVNNGQGSVGMLLNDPSYAQEIREAIRNVNRLLSRVGGIRFTVNVGGEYLSAYNGGRGWFQLQIWPSPDRYYLVGISVDPRDKITKTTTTNYTGGPLGGSSSVATEVNNGAIQVTAMLGKILWNRLDLAAGVLNGDGTVSAGVYLGPQVHEDALILRGDIYSQTATSGPTARITMQARPFEGTPMFNALYFRGGIDSVKRVNGKLPCSIGGGLIFDDEDIKLLFALKP